MIDVHIGFMDEEVSELLRWLIAMFGQERPILAIERGKVDEGGALFETPFSKYTNEGKEKAPIIHVESSMRTATTEKPPEALADRLAYNLHKEFYGDITVIEQRIKKRALLSEDIKMDGEPSFSIITFNPSLKNSENPIILIRNPEMGKQPSQVRPYERAILKAISGLKEVHTPLNINGSEAGIRIHSFASGGAIDPNIAPGFISRPWASLYIGAEVDAQSRVYAVVNLVALRKAFTTDNREILLPMHFEFFRQETATTAELAKLPENSEELKNIMKKAHIEAQGNAENYILNVNDDLLIEALENLSSHYKNEKHVSLEKLKTMASPHPDITASFSYFDGASTKEGIWDKLKQTVVNSNMEDYHVLRLVRSMLERGRTSGEYAPLIGCEILRLNVNIFVPKPLAERIIKYLDSARVTKSAYAASIIWGLKGCPLSEVDRLPEDARNWRFYDALKKEQSEYLKYFYIYDGHCMDPFCCEIATDLLKELIKKQGEMVSEAAFRLAQQVKAAAQNIDWKGDIKQLAKLVADLVDEMANNGYEADNGEMHCWLRPGKWGTPSNILKDNAPNEVASDPASVDRVLYKSANLLALQALARTAAQRTEIPNHK